MKNIKKLIIISGVLGVSLSAIFVKYAKAPSLVLVFYRTLFASILLLPIVWKNHKANFKDIGKKELMLSTLSGAFLGIHFTSYFQAIKWTSIASAVVLTDMEIFFVAFAMLLIFRDQIRLWGWLGIIIAFGGSMLIAISDAGGGKNIILGDLLAITAAFHMSIYTMIGTVCRKKMTTVMYTFLVYLSAAITVLIILIVTQTPIIGYESRDYGMALGMAVFCTILGHSVFSWGLKYEKASFIAIVKLLEPVFATILGILLFTEIPGLSKIAGGLFVIIGIIIYSLCSIQKSKNKILHKIS